MARERADVLVIGGGPAGSTVAGLVRRMNPDRRVVLFERAPFPRHHVGESTLPEMNVVLKKLGVLRKIEQAGFVKKTGITYRWEHDRPLFSESFQTGVLSAMASGDALPDHSWQVERARYDALLLEHARELGVEVHQPARVERALLDGERVCGLEVGEGAATTEWSSDVVVDCSGQARLMSRWLSMAPQSHPLGDLAIYRYYDGFEWNAELVGELERSKIFFSASRAGWVWFIPLSATRVSVGLVTRAAFLESHAPQGLLERELFEVPELAAMLKRARPCSAPGEDGAPARTHTVADWSYSHAVTAGPGWFLAGDAAAFIDPILSSGILLAHHSGLSVANAINTLWRHPEIAPADLFAGYSSFYAQLYGGFLEMARWWYQRRKVAGIDEWLELAAKLGASARGARQLESTKPASFMTFAAGFLTDFRFVNLGVGYGDRGLQVMVDQLGGDKDAVTREVLDRRARPRSLVSGAAVEAYLTTDVDSDRWWRLPELVLQGSFGERRYRPPVPMADREGGAVSRTLKLVEAVLAACDGQRDVDAVVRQARDRLGAAGSRENQQLANLVLSDLRLLGAVEMTPA
ncbi:MAG: tryptophan 7-halogenase [Archangiaceae bacterium]|nr:tryptophan 7-halogenase [Archangiaceae bacterium]